MNAKHPTAYRQSNIDYVYSQGWDFSIRTAKKTNNAGYAHEEDYRAEDHRPFMMVIGDSFVEARQVDAGSTAAELLNRKVADDGRVYSMALSDAPLSQYLKFAEFATDNHWNALANRLVADHISQSDVYRNTFK